jgi:hypothetical protein
LARYGGLIGGQPILGPWRQRSIVPGSVQSVLGAICLTSRALDRRRSGPDHGLGRLRCLVVHVLAVRGPTLCYPLLRGVPRWLSRPLLGHTACPRALTGHKNIFGSIPLHYCGAKNCARFGDGVGDEAPLFEPPNSGVWGKPKGRAAPHPLRRLVSALVGLLVSPI